MKVILIKDVKGTGSKGEVVKVKAGYANNYLIRNGFALEATKSNLAKHRRSQEEIAAELERQKEEAGRVFDLINGKEFEIKVKAGDGNRIFGSVTSMDIAEVLKNNNVEIDRKSIILNNPLKELGENEVEINLHKDYRAIVKIVLAKQ